MSSYQFVLSSLFALRGFNFMCLLVCSGNILADFNISRVIIMWRFYGTWIAQMTRICADFVSCKSVKSVSSVTTC